MNKLIDRITIILWIGVFTIIIIMGAISFIQWQPAQDYHDYMQGRSH